MDLQNDSNRSLLLEGAITQKEDQLYYQIVIKT